MAENRLVYEAIDAIRQGDSVHARAVLTRLITQEPTNAEYWVWLSSVSETEDERVMCLRQALRLDPKQADARAQLEQLGYFLPDSGAYHPELFPPDLVAAQPADPSPRKGRSRSFPGGSRQYYALGVWAAVFLLIAGMISIGLGRRDHKPLALPGTVRPSATLLPTTTLVVRSPTPTFTGPTPLWMFLEATYTPTPVYVNTPHPRSEAYRVALQKYQQGDLDGLVMYMDQVLFNEPDAADASFYLGEGYRLKGEPEEALVYYGKAIQTNPGFAPAYLGRAKALFDQNPGASFQQDLDQALSLDPHLIEAYLFDATAAIHRGDAAHALERLAQVEDRSSGSAAFYYTRAQAYLLDGQIELALQDAQEANRLDLTMLPSYRLLGVAFQASGDLQASIDPLARYLAYEEDDAEAWIFLAAAQHSVADDASALQSLDQALEADPRLGDAYTMRGVIYLDGIQEGNGHEAALRAMDEFTQATIYAAEPYALAVGKGRAYLVLDMPDLAVQSFNRAFSFAKKDAKKAAVYYWRAQAFAGLDQPDAELQDWQALLDLPDEACRAEWRALAQQRIEAP